MSTHAELPLGEVCTIVGGGTPRRGNAAFFGGSIPWATPTDVTALEGPFIEQTKETITQAGLRESSARLVPSGTVLMTSRATIGYTAIAAVPMATNQGLANLVCGDQLLPEYLAFWLRWQRDRLIQLAGGTTFKELSKSTLKRVRIPLPPLDEQRRIVDILNRAAGIEALRQRAAERLREFVPALFVKMFGDPVENPMGWPIQSLGDCCVQVQYGTSTKANDCGVGVPVLRMGNVTYGGALDHTDLKHVALSDGEIAKYGLRAGDILFNRTNSRELVGKTGLWDGRFPAVAASYFVRLRLHESCVCPAYVWAAMNSATMKRRLFAMARGAIGQANINARELKSIPLPVPPVELQRRYAQTVEAAGAVARVGDSSARAATALLASLTSELLGEPVTVGHATNRAIR
jgi:type I restriction enzyme S subunit